jgi:DNA replication protein DnaC
LRESRLERARYEAELARRRYLKVDPDNRLVADALEADWNERLRRLDALQQEHERQAQTDQGLLSEQARERIRALSEDFPRVWSIRLRSIGATRWSFAWRDTRRLERLLKQARLKYPDAYIEDLDTRAMRGLDQRLMATLASCDWVRAGQSIIATGATGLGKSWIACALGNQACRQGFSALYTRFSRLMEELRIAHGDGSFGKRLAQSSPKSTC